MNNLVIEIKNLKKYYGKIRGVDNVSIKINKGEAYGFIGPNGAGKSTTIKVLMNLINPTSGQIFINDKELDKNDITVKETIGYLPSEINLYDDLTVKEMLDFNELFYKKKTHKKRCELVKKLKLDESKKIEELSLGNLKKVAIVIAFMHSPKILILDEPTSGLDPIMQQVFEELLMEEKQKGTTILYSTHILSEISKICDRVGIIKEGSLITIKTKKQIEEENLTFVTIQSNDIEKIIKELDVDIVKQEEKLVKFKNNLLPDMLIKILSKYKIDKLLIEEATLEDMFIHYYK